MRSVTYKSVLDRVASYLAEADGLTVEDKSVAESKINLFVKLGWEANWHPDNTTVERRIFRPAYDNTVTYAASTATVATEVFWPGDMNYYQALQATTGNPPATESSGSWVVDTVHWAVSQASYAGDDWLSGTSYTAGSGGNEGSVVRNPNDGRFYMCIASHVAGASFDPSKFGVLTAFVRSLDYQQALTADGLPATPLGLVRFIWDKDPTITNTGRYPGRQQPYWLRQNYVQVGGCANVVWVEFQTRAPVFSGAVRSDTATYTSGTEVYDTPTGDYWTATASVNAGESPTSTPAKWAKVVFPYYLAEYAALSTYAMLTDREQEQPENFNVQMAAGWPLLQAEFDRVERMQGQVRQLRVQSGARRWI